MPTTKEKLIPFSNPLDDLPPLPDDWLDYKFADARRAVWRLLDTTAAVLVIMLDELNDKHDNEFADLAGELEEAYHCNLLVIRQALDNHRSGRKPLQGRR